MGGAGAARPESTRTPLRRHVPVSLRMHWRLVTVAGLGFLALVLVFGGSMVRPYITSTLVSETVATENVTGSSPLFTQGDHAIEVSYDTAEYADMMRVFREEGEKQYIHADITIDGTLVEDVGLRLKGNSTLSSLGGGGGPGGDRGGPPDMGGDGAMPAMPAMPEGANGGGMGGMTQLSEDEPQSLPWLISFDEFSEGRTYQGNAEIALRPASAGSDTAVNEAISIEVTKAAGQTTQDYTFTTFSVNGGETTTRLLLDSPDAQWADSLGDGVLYKSRAGGTLAYQGEDPTDYEESFKQINAEGSYDLQPVISLARFVADSSDEEFADDLDTVLDVDSFADYLALQELLSNFDAIDGPGSNYYLWYDVQEGRFTVLSWDLNLALGGMGGMGGMGGGSGFGGELPDGAEPPEGFPEGGQVGDMRGGCGPGGGAVEDSPTLKERFLEDPDYLALYERAYDELYESLIGQRSLKDRLEKVIDRAEAAGDESARSAGETALKTLESASAEAPDPSQTSMPGR